MQIYKYILFALTAIIFKFAFYYLIGLIFPPGPIWLFMKNSIIDSFTLKKFFATISLVGNTTASLFHEFDVFHIVVNEMWYFILGSFLIFITYKYNWRLDIISIIGTLTVIIVRILLFCFLKDFIPSISFYRNNFDYVFKSFYYNMPSMFIGIFFGLINYCIQKSSDFQTEEKRFLKLPLHYLKIFKSDKKYVILTNSIITFVLFVFNTIFYNMLYSISFQDDEFMDSFNKSKALNIFFLFNVEFTILIIFCFLIPFFIRGSGVLVSFFNNKAWILFTRTYYQYILYLNIITIYVFYQSESRIKVEVINLSFFSCLVLSITLFFSIINYTLLELPMKRLNKFFFEDRKVRVRKESEDSENKLFIS